MLRYNILLTVYKKNEETNQRDIDFPYDEVFANGCGSEINRLIHGQILVDDEGDIYELSVSRIQQEV